MGNTSKIERILFSNPMIMGKAFKKNCGTNIEHEIYLLNNKIKILKCLLLHLLLNVKKKKRRNNAICRNMMDLEIFILSEVTQRKKNII